MRIMNILVDMLVIAGVDETQAIYDVLLATQSVMMEHKLTCPERKNKIPDYEVEQTLEHYRNLEKESSERIKTTLIPLGHSMDMINRLIFLGQEEQYVSYVYFHSCSCRIPFF